MTKNHWEATLREFQPASARDLAEFYKACETEAGFAEGLIALLAVPDLETSAAWLLKRHVSSGHPLSPSERRRFIEALDWPRHWQSRLALLQILPFDHLSEEDCLLVEDFIRSNLREKNPFVRAWALNGFYEMGRQFPEFQGEAQELLEDALETGPASVRARVSVCLRKGFA